jgi:hypothetical protein
MFLQCGCGYYFQDRINHYFLWPVNAVAWCGDFQWNFHPSNLHAFYHRPGITLLPDFKGF